MAKLSREIRRQIEARMARDRLPWVEAALAEAVDCAGAAYDNGNRLLPLTDANRLMAREGLMYVERKLRDALKVVVSVRERLAQDRLRPEREDA